MYPGDSRRFPPRVWFGDLHGALSGPAGGSQEGAAGEEPVEEAEEQKLAEKTHKAGYKEIEEKLQMARELGMNMWGEYYPYAAGSSAIGADGYKPEAEEKLQERHEGDG